MILSNWTRSLRPSVCVSAKVEMMWWRLCLQQWRVVSSPLLLSPGSVCVCSIRTALVDEHGRLWQRGLYLELCCIMVQIASTTASRMVDVMLRQLKHNQCRLRKCCWRLVKLLSSEAKSGAMRALKKPVHGRQNVWIDALSNASSHEKSTAG